MRTLGASVAEIFGSMAHRPSWSREVIEMNEATIPVGPATAKATLPRPIRRVLGRLGLRLRMASCLRGLGTTILVMALLAAMGMAADLAQALPQLARWAIWGAWLACGGLILIATTLRPLVRRFGAFDLAAVAEAADIPSSTSG